MIRSLSKNRFLVNTLFIFLNIIIYIPFFTSGLNPFFALDTFDYMFLAEKISLGETPVTNLPIDIPVGYPLLIVLFNYFFGSAKYIALFQVIIFILSGTVLLNKLRKIFPGFLLASLIGLSVFSLYPIVVENNLRLLTDSIFTSISILIFAFLAEFIHKKDYSSFTWLSTLIVLAIFFRSNGIFFLPLIALPVFYFGLNGIKKFALVIVPALIINCFANYTVKGSFTFGDTKRVMSKIENFLETKKEKNEKKDKTIPKRLVISKKKQFISYASVTFNEMPSIYFSRVPTFKKMGNKLNKAKGEFIWYDGTISINNISPTLFQYATDGINLTGYNYPNYSGGFSTATLSHLMYKIFIDTKLALFIFLMFFVGIGFILIYSRPFTKSNSWIVILAINFILFLIALPFSNDRAVVRYIVPVIFVPLFIGTNFSIYLLKNKISPFIIKLRKKD